MPSELGSCIGMDEEMSPTDLPQMIIILGEEKRMGCKKETPVKNTGQVLRVAQDATLAMIGDRNVYIISK